MIFIIGSVMFFPAMEADADIGAWAFIFGSLLYLAVTGHDMVEAVVHARHAGGGMMIWNRLEIVQASDMTTLRLMNLTALAFVVGSVLFAVASMPYLWDLHSRADRRVLDAFLAWQFVAGSVLFLLGGSSTTGARGSFLRVT